MTSTFRLTLFLIFKKLAYISNFLDQINFFQCLLSMKKHIGRIEVSKIKKKKHLN